MSNFIKFECPPVIGYKLYKGGHIEVVRTEKQFAGESSNWLGDVDKTDYKQPPKSINFDSNGVVKEVRGVISEFSLKSRARMAWTLSTVEARFLYMSTLTYGEFYPKEPSLLGSHRNRVLNLVRRYYKKVYGEKWASGGVRGYFWFIEFQKRGAAHYHILLTDYVEVKRLLKLWVKINVEVGNDAGKVEYVHSRLDSRGDAFIMQGEIVEGGLVRYGVKYGLKMEQKTPPKWFNGRFYGYNREMVQGQPLDIVRCSESDLRYILDNHRVNKYDILPRLILGGVDDCEGG